MADPVRPAFRVDALPRPLLERVWASGRDAAGNRVEVMVNEKEGSAPLRCCLREAAAGERVALIAHRPFCRPGPYAEVGPVFIHAEPCAGYADGDRYPEPFRHRRQVFRAYDDTGRQVYERHTLVEGGEAETAIARILEDPRVAFIHSRNVLAGCYMFTICRA